MKILFKLQSATATGLFALAMSIGGGGCAHHVDPVWEDHWMPTATLCGWVGHKTTEEDYFLPKDAELYPSRACIDRLLQDVHADVPGFVKIDRISDLYHAVSTRDLSRTSRVACLLIALRGFFVLDAGTVAELHVGRLISQPYVTDMTRVGMATGQQNLNATLYNFVTSTILSTEPGTGTFDTFSLEDSRRLMVHDARAGMAGATAALVHEARHVWVSHGDCGDGRRQACDVDLNGAFGYEVATLVAIWRHSDSPRVRNMIQFGLERSAFTRILSLLDADHQVRPEWRSPQLDLSKD